MQIIFLLAGNNSRFFPLETMGHKAMNKLKGKPIVEYTLLELKAAGVAEFIFVLGKYDKDVIDYFGDGGKWGVKIEYAHQKEAKGQADAVLSAKKLIRGDFGFMNPYHFLQEDIFKGMLEKMQNPKIAGVIGGRYEENISEYSAFELDGNKIIGFKEKPKPEEAKSNIAKTSLEVYRQNFLGYLEKEPEQIDNVFYPSIEAMLKYIKDFHVELYEIPRGRFIPSLKFSWDLLELSEHLRENKNESDIASDVKIGENSKIVNSIIMEGVEIGDDCIISNSIIGKGVKIANGVRTNVEPEETTTVFTVVKGKEVNTEREQLGAVIGQETMIGENVTFQPGTLIGEKSQIDDNIVVSENLPHGGKL